MQHNTADDEAEWFCMIFYHMQDAVPDVKTSSQRQNKGNYLGSIKEESSLFMW